MHKKTLRDNGIKLVSAMENIPDTPEGIILESLLEGMAEYYSADCFYGQKWKKPEFIQTSLDYFSVYTMFQILKYLWLRFVGVSGSVMAMSPASNAGCI